jgi:predicted nucleic acid-binding protein
MKILVDTSIFVEIDRRNIEVITLLEKCIKKEHDILISTITITISEILVGPYQKENTKQAQNEVKGILSQFHWKELDADTAKKTAAYLAHLIKSGQLIGYQDTAIAATCTTSQADYLLTTNTKHFRNIPQIKDKVITPKELIKII